MTTTKHYDYVFTINNYKQEWIQQILNIPKTKYIIVGEEIAPTTGTPHLQGYIYFETQKTFTSVQKLLKPFNTPFIEPRMKKSTPEKASNYCKEDGKYHERGTIPQRGSGIVDVWTQIKDQIKEGSSLKDLTEQYPEIAGRYTKGLESMHTLLKPPSITYNIKDDVINKQTTLYSYQKQLLEYIETAPSERSILWIYDETGNSGKSSITNHLEDNNNFISLSNGKTADIAYQWNGENVIFDFARSQQKFINYEIIECIKNGRVNSTKYIPVRKKYKQPHVIIMSNFKPDTSKLSKDRWAIYEIDSNKSFQDITEQTLDEQTLDKQTESIITYLQGHY